MKGGWNQPTIGIPAATGYAAWFGAADEGWPEQQTEILQNTWETVQG